MQSSHADVKHGIRQPSKRRRPMETHNKPVYGNFQRYYHIRNPADLDLSDGPSSSIHPALAIDSRVTAILQFLRRHYEHGEPPQQCIKVLDLGCNSGKLTIELAQTLPRLLHECGQQPSQAIGCVNAASVQLQILGVDIDASLVKQAKTAAAVARSRYRPEHLDASTEESRDERVDSLDSLPPDFVHFPSVFPSLYGCKSGFAEGEVQSRHAKRQQKETDSDSKTRSTEDIKADVMAAARNDSQRYPQGNQLCPPNLQFVALDWADPKARQENLDRNVVDTRILAEMEENRLNMTLALSITKWIHIQKGDLGLTLFFARIADTLKPGGLLFLEPQEWTSYHSAKNLDHTIKGKIKSLQLRPGGDFEWWLSTFGLQFETEIGQGKGFGFSRSLQVFRKARADTVEVLEAKCLVEKLLKDGGRSEEEDRTIEPIPWVARSASPARVGTSASSSST
ncbi:RNA methyltransferase [Pseudozyma hubeiensis]|nr:RNA methyltransferase [Pseudozyma hubeiensis]